MPLVSIIIPVYNREKTLRYCLNSVLDQTMRDFEVIIIDDGSTDKSAKICHEYALNNNKIHYFYKGNGGVSSARNLGISKAQGQWITFVDSDDYIMPYHLDIVMEADNECDQILTELGYATKENILSDSLIADNKCEAEVYNGNEKVLTYLFEKRNPYKNKICFCTTRFFKTALIKRHQMKFREDLSLDEDFLFATQYQLYSNKLLYKKIYSYKEIDSSMSRPQLTCYLRSPEDLLATFKANYLMFLRVYKQSHLNCVKDYGIYYFNNKIFDYLLIGYSQLSKWKYLPRKDFYIFIKNRIIPFFNANPILTTFCDKNNKRCFLFLLRNNYGLILMIYTQIISICRSFNKRLSLNFIMNKLRKHKHSMD